MADETEHLIGWLRGVKSPLASIAATRIQSDAAEIARLKAEVAEARAKTVADVAAWLRKGAAGMIGLIDKDIGLASDTMAGLKQNASHCEQIATALETGEWEK